MNKTIKKYIYTTRSATNYHNSYDVNDLLKSLYSLRPNAGKHSMKKRNRRHVSKKIIIYFVLFINLKQIILVLLHIH